MKLTQLQYFLAIVEYGSISEADNALKMSQSALSTALSHLEQEVGQPLFTRQHDGMIPNEAAEAILPTVHHIFEAIAKIEGLKQQQRPLKIAGISEAMPLLYEYHRLFSADTAELAKRSALTENSFEQWDGLILNEQHSDFLQHCTQKGICTIHLLAQAKPMLYISTRHPLAAQSQIQLQDLSGQRLFIPADHQLLFPKPWTLGSNITYFEDINTAKMITSGEQGCAILPPYLFIHDFYIAQGLTKLVAISDNLAEAQLYLALSNRRLNTSRQHELSRWFASRVQASAERNSYS